MKYFVFTICILLISCVDEISLKSVEANSSVLSHDYIDVPPGSDVVIDSVTYKAFKVPVYDAGSDALFNVNLLSTETLASFNVRLTAKSEAVIGLLDMSSTEEIFIDGHRALVTKNCGYSMTASSRESYCFAVIYIEIENMVLEAAIADRSNSQSIVLSDYDFTDQADQSIYAPWVPDAIIDEFIDYIHIEQIGL